MYRAAEIVLDTDVGFLGAAVPCEVSSQQVADC